MFIYFREKSLFAAKSSGGNEDRTKFFVSLELSDSEIVTECLRHFDFTVKISENGPMRGTLRPL